MTSAPLIGLTTYGRDDKNRFTLYAEYVDGIRRAGGIPVLMPPGETRVDEWLGTVDGLLLAGGGDLDPVCYGGTKPETVYNVDAERDGSELRLARQLLDSELPGLCICRGMQVLNVVLGGTLIEHLPNEVGEDVLHRLPPREPVRHPVRVDGGSHLASILGERDLSPFSWHHQAIRELASGLEVVARAPDGVIEAVELSDRRDLICIQWHPELSAHEDRPQQRLFDAFVARAAAFRAKRNA